MDGSIETHAQKRICTHRTGSQPREDINNISNDISNDISNNVQPRRPEVGGTKRKEEGDETARTTKKKKDNRGGRRVEDEIARIHRVDLVKIS
mmetsp:Transcript_12823/g.35414  ORF Transcript_12823/g.35414 Transcript_12823/m.35414 type:complete len:93 (-) Transcript_12823:955-1233(-)